MFRNMSAGARNNECGYRRDVERRGAITAAGAARVEQRLPIQPWIYSRRLFTHRLREAEQFFRSFTLGPEAHQERGNLGCRRLAAQNVKHRATGIFGGQVLTPGDAMKVRQEHFEALAAV